jgi:hypothetical protein
MDNGNGLKTALALDRKQLDALLGQAAADYGLNLAEPEGLATALLVVNTLFQMENTRLLLKIQQTIG